MGRILLNPTQNPPLATACRFESGHRHQLVASVISLATSFFISLQSSSRAHAAAPPQTEPASPGSVCFFTAAADSVSRFGLYSRKKAAVVFLSALPQGSAAAVVIHPGSYVGEGRGRGEPGPRRRPERREKWRERGEGFRLSQADSPDLETLPKHGKIVQFLDRKDLTRHGAAYRIQGKNGPGRQFSDL